MPKFTKYDRLIMELAAEYPRAADVWRQFQSKADEEEWSDIPGERTVKRRVDEFHKLQPAEKREYSRFRWPQTMIDGALPWEASRAGLDLLRYYEDQDRGNDAWAIKEGLGVRSAGEGWERPTVRAVKWLHRVRQAAPSIQLHVAIRLAGWLDTVEWAINHGVDDPPYTFDSSELALAYDFDRAALSGRVAEDWLVAIQHGAKAFVNGMHTAPSAVTQQAEDS